MIGLQLAASLLCVLYGVWACARRKQPLFFKLLLYAMASYLLGTLFAAGYALVYGREPQGFHVGILGYMGTYFFLLSSYYGAINRLADGGEARYRGYRLVSAAGPLLVLALLVHSVRTAGTGASLAFALLAVPIAPTLYFSTKHLILPDVDLGIIRVMRPYNACVIMFCAVQVCARTPVFAGTAVLAAAPALLAALLATLLPMAEMGVRKWFI